MSAYIVPKEHIDALIRAGLHISRGGGPLRWYHADQGRQLLYEDANDVGKMLWMENFKSLASRYPDTRESLTNYPGSVDFTPFDVELYEFDTRSTVRGKVAPEKVLKAIHGYEYQACEHDGWQESEAYRFCRSLERAMIDRLPGYDKADTWSVDSVSQIMQGPIGMEL